MGKTCWGCRVVLLVTTLGCGHLRVGEQHKKRLPSRTFFSPPEGLLFTVTPPPHHPNRPHNSIFFYIMVLPSRICCAAKKSFWYASQHAPDHGGRGDAFARDRFLQSPGTTLDSLERQGYAVGPAALLAGFGVGSVTLNEVLSRQQGHRSKEWEALLGGVIRRSVSLDPSARFDQIEQKYIFSKIVAINSLKDSPDAAWGRILLNESNPNDTTLCPDAALLLASSTAEFERYLIEAGYSEEKDGHYKNSTSNTLHLRWGAAGGVGWNELGQSKDVTSQYASDRVEVAEDVRRALLVQAYSKAGRFDLVCSALPQDVAACPITCIAVINACAERIDCTDDVYGRLGLRLFNTLPKSPASAAALMKMHCSARDLPTARAFKTRMVGESLSSPLLLHSFQELLIIEGETEAAEVVLVEKERLLSRL